MKAAILAGLFAWGIGVAVFIADDKKSPPATPQPTTADEGLPKKKRRIPSEDARTPPAVKSETRPETKVAPKKVMLKTEKGPVEIDAPPAPRARETKVNDDIEGILDQASFADFSDTPLRQVLLFMSTQHNIRIYIDEVGLAAAMVDRDQGVTFQMAGVRFGLVLDLLLEPLNLDYTVRENVLIISSREQLAALRSTAVLRIGDLADGHGGASKASAQRLVELITENIDRDGWIVNGGDNSIQFVEDARSLVVTSNSKTQRKISKLLTDLRSAKLATGMPIKKGDARVAAN